MLEKTGKTITAINRATSAGATLVIRPFRKIDKDYQAVVAIENAIGPETPASVSAWKHWDCTRDSQYLFRRHVAELDGEIVAAVSYGHTAWMHQPGKYFVRISVAPRFQRRGIGSILYDFVVQEKLGPRDPQKLVSFTREDRRHGIRFLQKRGFRQVMRTPVSRLDSGAFDVGKFEAKVQRVLASGIAIKTMRQLQQEDPEWKRKLYELEWECLQDVPSTDPFTKRSFEQFEKSTLGSPNLLPDAWFVALDGDQYVGLSVLWRNLATDRLLETGLTGVIRSHRRRGIATAMKVNAIRYAQEHDNATIETDNEENNPMFQLNLQLGFVPQPAYLDFEKTVGT